MGTTYADELVKISRIPFKMAVITLDYCSRTFGAAPCTATGTKCYNTRYTCKDPANYTLTTKDYTFTSITSPLPLKTGERPYLKEISALPTEIKDSLTVAGRVSLKFNDEEDTDVGIDPYLSGRTSVQGTYWKKLLARNIYYKGRPVKIYQGFVGSDGTCDYEQIWYGEIQSIQIANSGDVTIEAIDVLKSIKDIEIPAETDCKLLVDIDSTRTQLTLDKTSDLDSTGIIIIGDEIIQYSSNSTVTNMLSGCTRAAFGTASTAHKVNAKVQKCKYFTAKNPFDHLHDMLAVDGGISTSMIDTTAFTAAKDHPMPIPINYAALLTQPTPLEDLYFDLLDHLDAKSWVAENLKITVSREYSNKPSRSYSTISDTENIVIHSDSANLNVDNRLSRCVLYWQKESPLTDLEDPESYERINIGLDADAESSFEFGESQVKKIWSQWIYSSAGSTETIDMYTRNLVMRRIARHREAECLIDVSVELKDSELKTGDYIKLNSDVLLNPDGTTLSGVKCQIIKREQVGDVIKMKLQKMPERRLAFISAASAVSSAYSTATSASKEYGYIGGNNARMANDDPCYRIY